MYKSKYVNDLPLKSEKADLASEKYSDYLAAKILMNLKYKYITNRPLQKDVEDYMQSFALQIKMKDDKRITTYSTKAKHEAFIRKLSK
jgi:hypothetical protein